MTLMDSSIHLLLRQVGSLVAVIFAKDDMIYIYIAEALMLIRRMYVKNFDLNLSKIVTAISYIININRSNFIVGIRLHFLSYNREDM